MSLAGRGVLVTRPRGLAQGLARRIEAAGGRAIVFPTIEIVPLPQAGPMLRYDLVVFVSPTAVVQGARWIDAGEKVLALGAGTAHEIMKSRKDVIFPACGADSEALLALPELADVAARQRP